VHVVNIPSTDHHPTIDVNHIGAGQHVFRCDSAAGSESYIARATDYLPSTAVRMWRDSMRPQYDCHSSIGKKRNDIKRSSFRVAKCPSQEKRIYHTYDDKWENT